MSVELRPLAVQVGMEPKHPVAYDVGGLSFSNVSLAVSRDRAPPPSLPCPSKLVLCNGLVSAGPFLLLASREGGRFTDLHGDVEVELSGAAAAATVCHTDVRTFGKGPPVPNASAVVAKCG